MLFLTKDLLAFSELFEKRCTIGVMCARPFERGLHTQCVVRALLSFQLATLLQTEREGSVGGGLLVSRRRCLEQSSVILGP